MLFPKLSKVDKCVRAQSLGALSLICPSGAVSVRAIQQLDLEFALSGRLQLESDTDQQRGSDGFGDADADVCAGEAMTTLNGDQHEPHHRAGANASFGTDAET